MRTSDFTITYLVDQAPEEVFNAINNVRGWWSEEIEGGTHKLNDVFHYHYKDMHDSSQKLVELVPNKKVVWLVTDSSLNFIDQKDEWNGTRIVFEVGKKGKKTEFRFTHQGLTPDRECFEACSGGWTYYISDSLYKLITTGKGKPEKKKSKAKISNEAAN